MNGDHLPRYHGFRVYTYPLFVTVVSCNEGGKSMSALGMEGGLGNCGKFINYFDIPNRLHLGCIVCKPRPRQTQGAVLDS